MPTIFGARSTLIRWSHSSHDSYGTRAACDLAQNTKSLQVSMTSGPREIRGIRAGGPPYGFLGFVSVNLATMDAVSC